MVGSGVVLTQLGGYQVGLVWSPGMRLGQVGHIICSIITIDSIRLGHEYKLVIAGKLLVADHKGHPVFGIIKHLREQRLLPLQVQVLKVNSEMIIVES